jgi:hypothetical protein
MVGTCKLNNMARKCRNKFKNADGQSYGTVFSESVLVTSKYQRDPSRRTVFKFEVEDMVVLGSF